MKKGSVQDQIKNLESQRQEIDKKINSLTIQLSNESASCEWIEIPGTEYEVTKQVIYKGKSYNEIMKLKKPEEELLTLKLIGTICENQELLKTLKMDGSSKDDDFYIQQYDAESKKKGYVADFVVDWSWSGFFSDGDPRFAYGCRGVRFCRKKISRGKK